MQYWYDRYLNMYIEYIDYNATWEYKSWKYSHYVDHCSVNVRYQARRKKTNSKSINWNALDRGGLRIITWSFVTQFSAGVWHLAVNVMVIMDWICLCVGIYWNISRFVLEYT